MCVSCQHIISTHGHQASSFIRVSLLLEEGDKVKVNLYPGQWIFDNGEHHHSVDICCSPCEPADRLFTQKSIHQGCTILPTKINLYNVTEYNQVACKIYLMKSTQIFFISWLSLRQ